MVVSPVHLVHRLSHDVLCVGDLALASILAESVEVFDRKGDHVGLLGADHFKVRHSLLQLGHAADDAMTIFNVLLLRRGERRSR